MKKLIHLKAFEEIHYTDQDKMMNKIRKKIKNHEPNILDDNVLSEPEMTYYKSYRKDPISRNKAFDEVAKEGKYEKGYKIRLGTLTFENIFSTPYEVSGWINDTEFKKSFKFKMKLKTSKDDVYLIKMPKLEDYIESKGKDLEYTMLTVKIRDVYFPQTK